MDPAQELEAFMLAQQKPMNEVIDRGDSAVQQFYSDAVVFVTGGSGFLGKQLIEKLFRSCKIKKMYMLLRPKKGKTIKERLDYTLSDTVFDLVRKKQPFFADRIVPLEGDVADIRLGLSDQDWNTIAQEVDMVLHMAATIRFDETLRFATMTNVRGTRYTLELAKECKNLRNYVYVSTAYTHATSERVGKQVSEQFYPTPMNPETLIQLAETLEDERLNGITAELIKGWPNTYTFTKAVAEEAVRTFPGNLPICVVRPPIVINSYLEPSPGWLDNSCVMGPIGILIGGGLGVLHVFSVDKDKRLALVPVDYVNNAIIAAGWDSVQTRLNSNEPPVYTVANNDCQIKWAYVSNLIKKEGVKLSTPKAVWYCFLLETKYRLAYWFLSWLFHYIPAYLLDGVCAIVPVKSKQIPSLVKIYNTIDKLAIVYKHFLFNEWKFTDNNVRNMIHRMSDDDKKIFNCDLTTVDERNFFLTCVVGARKYIIKDGITGSNEAFRKQKMFGVANFVFMVLYFYTLWRIVCVFWMYLSNVFY